MKSYLLFVAAMGLQLAQAERPPVRIEGRDGDQRVIIRVNEDNREDRNQNARIRELEKAVRDLQYRVYELEDRVIGNRPPVRPAGPVCTLMGPGVYNGYNRAFRIAVDGQVLMGTDFMSTAFSTLQEYKNNNICTLDTNNYQCSLMGPGVYNNYQRAFRVGIKNLSTGQIEVVSGTDFQSTALSTMADLKKAGLCYQ